MKYLLVLFVIVLAAWLLLGSRGDKASSRPRAPKATDAQDPQTMLACAHCGLHLPEVDATRDGAGRVFCSEAHRLAGPR